MTREMVARLRIVDSILYLSLLLENHPRSIDRYIDYFGDRHPGHPSQRTTK
ncbi:MAG: hypothetical protein ACREKS_13365 [Candidatus Rokuibacteriota bacterium]